MEAQGLGSSILDQGPGTTKRLEAGKIGHSVRPQALSVKPWRPRG